MIGFGVIGCIGCLIVFSQGLSIQNGMQDLTNTLLDSTSDLKNQTNDILKALNVSKSQDELAVITKFISNLNKDVVQIVDKVDSKRSELDGYMQQAQAFVESVSILLFLLASAVVWATLKQKVRLALIFAALLSLCMVLSWLVWGSLTVVGVALDDMCWSMDMWNVNKTHADITNDLIPCMNPGDSVYSMNVLRYEVYKNIADMNEKLFAKDETFCTEFYPVPEREVCEDHEEDGLYSRNSFGSTVCNARGGGYLGSNTTFVLPDTEMDNGDVLCEDNSLNRRGLLQRTSSTRYLSITSNYDFEQAVNKCYSHYATCVSDVRTHRGLGREFNHEHGLRFEVQVQFCADLSKWDVSA